MVAGIEQRKWRIGETQTRLGDLRDGDGAKKDGRRRRVRADRGTGWHSLNSFKHGLWSRENWDAICVWNYV